jgi:hypothetical protein
MYVCALSIVTNTLTVEWLCSHRQSLVFVNRLFTNNG